MRAAERHARAAAYERARPEILEHIPRSARRVLDLGCATGTTGAALKQRQPAHVTGIELEPEYAAEATTNLDEVIVGDIAAPPPLEGPFDALIAADVLEHLTDPWTALTHYAQLLEPGATAVVSLPNIAHWSTYAYLVKGTWPRKPEGIFDATHLRWFTRRDALALLQQAGLTPHTVVARRCALALPWRGARAPTPVPARRWLLNRGSRFDALAPPLPLFTFQHVIA